jgi:transposase-like protein
LNYPKYLFFFAYPTENRLQSNVDDDEEEKRMQTSKKRKQKTYSDTKILDVVSVAVVIDNNMAVGRYFGVPESTVRRWRDQLKDTPLPQANPDILTHLRSCKKRTRKPLFEDLEIKLFEWVREQRQKNLPLSQGEIRNQALALHKQMPQYKKRTLKPLLGGFTVSLREQN